MKLFNKTIDRQLFNQYSLGSDLSKQEVVVKIFNPYGNGTWFILNSDPDDPDYLWAIVDLGYGAEVGSVSRSELETYRNRMGWGFERDLSFDPVNALELYQGLTEGKFYAKGGGVGSSEENTFDKIFLHYGFKKKRGAYGVRPYEHKKLGSYAQIDDKTRSVQIETPDDEYKGGYSVKGVIEFLKSKGFEETGSYADGGNLSRDRKFLNHNEQYEVDYSKGKSRKGYGSLSFADGGEIEVVYERRADFKKKPIRLLLLTKGKEQKGYTFSGKEQVAVLDNYNRNKQEDLEKLWNLKGYESKYADGGDIENFSDNQRMIMNQNVEVEHHHEELEDILEDEVPVPAWVVAKMETATQNLSDITHYLDGQKEIKKDQFEDDDDDDDDEIENKEVVEPINVSAGTKAELTKKFTDDAWGNLRGFLKGMEGIDLRDDYTFDYKDEQFEVEPIINSDENGVSNAVFSIFDGDGEDVADVYYSRDGGKQKFTANSEFFSWNNAKFEDGGYFDGAIPNASAYMSTYAKGGEVAKAEVLGLSKNIMGTTDIEMKISGMRKSQDFIVYPISADDTDKIITIQSSTRIGKIDLSTGRGLMSQSHSNGAYFVHFQMDKLTPFTVSESDLEDIKAHIFRTAGSNIGTRGIVSDNSGASRLFADGGFIQLNKTSLMPQEFQLVEWSLNGHSVNFRGKMYFQKGTGLMFIEKENGDIYEPKSNNKLYWRKIKEYANGGGIGFIPMALEQDLSYTAKWGGTDIKGVIGILNAMIDSGLTDEDLKPKPTKSGTAHQNAIEKRTNEIWAKIEPEYKGDLKGNMPYSTIRRLVDRANSPDEILKRFKPFRKNQKDSFADGGGMSKFDKLSNKVAKQYEGKPVKSEYQDEYGKVYSKEEAKEVGDKVAGKMKAMTADKKAFGGLFGGAKKLMTPSKKYPDISGKQGLLKSGKYVQVFQQNDNKVSVIELGKIGSGVRPHFIDISEVDIDSFKAGGKLVGKRVNGGTETLKRANELAKEIRKDGESWFDAKKRAFAQLKK